jgi:hypothetical protein
MTADGKLKEVGIPTKEAPASPSSTRDSIRLEQTRRVVFQNKEKETEIRHEQEVTTRKEMGGETPTQMPMPFVPTIF